MQSIEELEQELTESEAHTEALERQAGARLKGIPRGKGGRPTNNSPNHSESLRTAYKQAIEKSKADQRALRNEIMDRMGQEPGVETIKLDDQCPQFPKTSCVAEVTLVNGMKFILRRQHSYWRIDTAKGTAIKVRYAKDARKLARVAAKDYKEDIMGAREVKAEERKELHKKLRRERREVTKRLRREREEKLLGLRRERRARLTPKRAKLGG